MQSAHFPVRHPVHFGASRSFLNPFPAAKLSWAPTFQSIQWQILLKVLLIPLE